MKKIMFAVFAISAIVLLNSCGNESAHRTAGPNGPAQTTIGITYGYGERDQTSTNLISYTGTIDGISDVDMVPVRMCSNELVWAKFADNLYKIGVEANNYVAKGHRVDVTMRIVKPWFRHDYFEIIDVKIFPKIPVVQPCDTVQKPTPVVKKPVRKVTHQSGSGRCFPMTQGFVTTPQPQTVVIQQQPCCCGTNITINGTNNAPIITGNGNNTGAIDVPSAVPVQPEPIWRPVAPQNDHLKDFNPIPNGKMNLDSSKTRNVVAKSEMKKEPMTWPWTKD